MLGDCWRDAEVYYLLRCFKLHTHCACRNPEPVLVESKPPANVRICRYAHLTLDLDPMNLIYEFT